MSPETTQKIATWLNGNYDEVTKNTIKDLQNSHPTEFRRVIL